MSASDDRTVRLWDVAEEKEMHCFRGHTVRGRASGTPYTPAPSLPLRLSFPVIDDRQDYIRAGTVCEDNANLLITGSYDHTVKLWDVRSGECTLTINHGSPVESLLVFPGASAIITAGASSNGKNG